MIEFKPNYNNSFKCFRCDSLTNNVIAVTFLGVSSIAECFCQNCNQTFYHTLPLGHTIYFPIAFDLSSKSFDERARKWLAEPLIRSYLNKQKIDASIVKKGKAITEEVIILNCLDSCFGHVLIKLLNAQYYLENFKERDLIIIVPKQCAFFVPEGVSEVWSVDIELKLMDKWIEPFDSFVKEEITRFEKVFLGLAYLHHDYSKIDLSSLIKIRKRNIDEFNDLDLQVTFFAREDRIWISNSREDLLLRINKKFKAFKVLLPLLIYRENKKINKLKKLISKEFPKVRFVVTGTGKRGGLAKEIIDLRKKDLTEEIQKEWWDEFSKTHILIGMHGSNMLIPTYLSLSFIDLVPRNKIFNYSDDIIVSHLTPNLLFFSRFLDIFSSSHLVAQHAIGILKNFKLWNKELKVEHKVWNNQMDLYNSLK